MEVLTALGPLQAGVDAGAAADVVWILNDPGLYHQLVVEQGWQPPAFAQWLSKTMKMHLLPR